MLLGAKRIFALAILILLMAGDLLAGSVFSFNGQGYPVRRLGPRSYGMGGAGRAVVDGQDLSSLNPALLGGFRSPAVFSTLGFQRRNVEDASTSQAIADGDLVAIRAVFPFRFRGAFSVGVEQVTDTDVTVIDTVGTGPEQHALLLNATGGIGSVVFGFGQRLYDRFYLGVQADVFVVGTLTEAWEKPLLNEPNEPFQLFSVDEVSRSHQGAQLSFGLGYTPGNLSIGATLKPRATVTQKVRVDSKVTTLRITGGSETTERDIHFPTTVAFGVAYARSSRWMLAADYEYAAWSDTGSGRHDTSEFALGAQYQTLPNNPRRLGRRYDLMAGVFRRSLYFATASGVPIHEMGATVGLALPFKRQAGKLRWSLEVGQRGNVQDHGASERYFKQTISVSGWIQ